MRRVVTERGPCRPPFRGSQFVLVLEEIVNILLRVDLEKDNERRRHGQQVGRN